MHTFVGEEANMRNEWTRRLGVLAATAMLALGAGCVNRARNPTPGTGGSGNEPTPQTQPNTPTVDQGQGPSPTGQRTGR